MSRASRHKYPGQVVKLTRRGRARTAAELRQARIESDTEAAVSALLETQAPEHHAAILRAVHRVASRQMAKTDGPVLTASFLAAEAYRLCPLIVAAETPADAERERVFGAARKRAGGAGG